MEINKSMSVNTSNVLLKKKTNGEMINAQVLVTLLVNVHGKKNVKNLGTVKKSMTSLSI